MNILGCIHKDRKEHPTITKPEPNVKTRKKTYFK